MSQERCAAVKPDVPIKVIAGSYSVVAEGVMAVPDEVIGTFS